MQTQDKSRVSTLIYELIIETGRVVRDYLRDTHCHNIDIRVSLQQ